VNNCPSCCAADLVQVYNAARQITVGWYCPGCHYFDRAIGRERLLGISPHDNSTKQGYCEVAPKNHTTGELP